MYKTIQYFLLTLLLFASLGAQIMHPPVKLLDANQQPVIQSGHPVSTLQTCGACHDAEYITTHSYHSTAGMNEINFNDNKTWELGRGYYGKWQPLYYQVLENSSDTQYGTANWIMTQGVRHTGGGPAEHGINGSHLDAPNADLVPMEKYWYNPKSDETETWDWQQSGVIEMNCFLCHIPNPANEVRKQTIQSGQFKWANTATLENTGLVAKTSNSWKYNRTAFDQAGHVKMGLLQISDPGNSNCGLCHGIVQEAGSEVLTLDDCSPEQWTTINTGQIFSPQRISESGMNIKNKENLDHSWDIHAERLVECVDCHFSLNNPIYYQESNSTRPAHLKFDARRMDIDEYLHRPSHQFARGPRANEAGQVQPNTMRRCESCHDTENTHNWLPYKERHMTTMTCEACHVPYLHASTKQSIDWTLPDPDGTARIECRGIDEGTPNANTLMQGFQPVLLNRMEADSSTRLAPYNLITTWYWADNATGAPVALNKLTDIMHHDGHYKTNILQILDENQNGGLEQTERILNTQAKISAIQSLLQKEGLDVKLLGSVEPHAIHHNVVHGDWATRSCETCHSAESRLAAPITLASDSPPVKPDFAHTGLTFAGGKISRINNSWQYTPVSANNGLFILGHNKNMIAQITGAALFLIVLAGILIHGSIRFIALAQHKIHPGPYHKAYMYSLYERFWHWMQAIAIIGLIITGLTIHSPLFFKFMPFQTAVIIHNVLGFLLLINAFLAAFYHYSSGKIKHFIPEPKGFFSQTIDQGLYYIKGIFNNEPHPFEKNIDKKLNPLQKITYLVILNVLLPLQIITGIVIWGVQRWPEISTALGGLELLVPFHSLMAWFFAAFLILHMYLTTTGYTATSSLKAMVTGWEKLKDHE